MSGIGSNIYKPGVLQGVVMTPGSNEAVEIRYTGSPLDLMKVAIFLGMEPIGDQEDDDPVTQLKDERGGYATIQPAERASDLLQTIAQMAQQKGIPPFPFL